MSDTPRNNKTKSKGGDYIVQGSILAAAAVITKVIGVVYRIPLTNLLGDEGNGFYGYAYQVYAFALMISSLSLPTAVSKIVSMRVSVGQKRNAFRAFFVFACFCHYCGIYHCSRHFLRGRGNLGTCHESTAQCLCIESACTRIVYCSCHGSAARILPGAWHNDATAVSQVIEQIINAVVSIVGAGVLFESEHAQARRQAKNS